MRGLIIVLLSGAVPLVAYLLSAILDDTAGGNIAAYVFLASIGIWGTAMVIAIALIVVGLRRRRLGT